MFPGQLFVTLKSASSSLPCATPNLAPSLGQPTDFLFPPFKNLSNTYIPHTCNNTIPSHGSTTIITSTNNKSVFLTYLLSGEGTTNQKKISNRTISTPIIVTHAAGAEDHVDRAVAATDPDDVGREHGR